MISHLGALEFSIDKETAINKKLDDQDLNDEWF